MTDAQLYNKLVRGNFKNRQIGDRIEAVLGESKALNVFTQK
jgi:hypothetical protein